MRISNQTRLELFNGVSGIEMHRPEEVHPVDEKYIVRKINDNPDVISDEEVALRMANMDLSYGSGGNWYKI